MHELHTPIATLPHPNTQPQHQQQLNSNCNKNNYYCHKTNYGNNKRKNSAYNKSFRAINNNKRMNTNSGFSNHRRSFVDRQYSDVLIIRNSTQILEELLESKFQIMESLPQIQLREKVINLLDVCVSEWLKMEELKLKTCIPLHQFGRVLPFGSYFLGAHCVASDIDVVCLCPNIVTSEDFFTDFVDIAQQHGSLITNVKVVKDAHIPVIRMKINDIEVDLLFATLPVQFLSNNHLIFLRNNVDSMDFPSQKSIHGRLECEELMDLLPASLITKFQTVLRAVKFWAQRRGVYKSIYGYLGGFSFAILVAKLCLMFSDMEAGDIFANFFRVYSHWRWPNPVKLNMNSFYPVHFQEIMPIIGPVSPHKNTSHTVSLSTFSVMMAELQRADRILSQIATTPHILPQAGQSNTKTKDSEVNSTPWDEIFEPLDFGNMYNMYICISVESDSYEAHHLSVGFIESKIRYLILELEKYNIFPHVCPKYFSEIVRNKDTKPVYRSCFYLGLDIVKPDMDQLQEILQCGIDVLMSVYASNTLNMYLTPEISIVNKDHVLQSIKNQDSAQIPISSNTQATTVDGTMMKIVE